MSDNTCPRCGNAWHPVMELCPPAAPKPSIISPPLDTAATVARMAKLSAVEYDQQRTEIADLHGIRVTTLDKLVKGATGGGEFDDSPVEDLEPWPEPVDGVELADTVRNLLNRHLVLADGGTTIGTLWTFGAYAYDSFRIFPKLLISSPEKRCGKSTLLECIEALTPRAILTTGMTAPTLFRLVESCHPTLLLDEVDRWCTSDNPELVGVLNAGHTKRSAYVWRLVGDDHKPTRFSVWGAMALAGINKPPDTIVDRSVHIEMRRKAPGETRAKVPGDLFEGSLGIRRKLARWAIDNADVLRGADPVVPKVGNDRAEDNWRVLLAIAQTIGGEYYERARDVFVAAHKNDAPEDTVSTMLLTDLREVIKTDRMYSDDLVDALVKLTDRPWGEWRHGKPITANGLARLLRPFRISPKTLRIADDRRKGYEAKDFADTFVRYLPIPAATTVTPCQPSNGADSKPNANRDANRDPDSDNDSSRIEKHDSSRIEKPREATDGAGCHGVTDEPPPTKQWRI